MYIKRNGPITRRAYKQEGLMGAVSVMFLQAMAEYART